MRTKTNITLKESFLNQHPKYPIIIKRWEESTKTEFNFQNITSYNLKVFRDHLLRCMSRNGAKTYIAKICSVLNLHTDTVKLPYNWKSYLCVKPDSSQQTYLNKREIKAIFEYKAKNLTERVVQLQFILGCLTGARRSDYINFTKNNIHKNNLIYCAKKTGTSVTVPVTKATRNILKELDEINHNIKNMSSVHFNNTLKRICKAVGIKKVLTLHWHGVTETLHKYEFVSSHTARRSFATNLYIDGVDIYDISKMCGHSNISITERYICSNVVFRNKIKKHFDCYDEMLCVN